MVRTSKSLIGIFLSLLFGAGVLLGCGARADEKVELTVFAASSLTDVFGELGEEFERQNPGVEVRFNFSGSSALLAQLQQGAPADVFAPADKAKMKDAAKAEILSGPQVFAGNSLVLIVPKSNPANVRALQDLARPELDLVLAQENVPIAEYTEEIVTKADAHYGKNFKSRATDNVVSREPDVRASANRVALGEADATFVYVSDVTPEVRDSVEVVQIPADLNVTATYPIAITKEAPNPDLAREWVDLTLSEKGQRVIGEWGFKRAR